MPSGQRLVALERTPPPPPPPLGLPELGSPQGPGLLVMTLGDVNKHWLSIHQRQMHFEKCWVVFPFENLMLGAKSKLVTLKPES